ncbi:MAG: hypothetical protein OSB00_07725 [Sphingomonas bacterium]|nr:hypothetical protein [Sphingomonas bacterium]
MTQADRDAAADLYLDLDGLPYSPRDLAHADEIRRGKNDAHASVQAFARHRLSALSATPSEAMVERLREALRPSAATKAAYIGEFSFLIDIEHEGEETTRKLDVPWTTIKEIMAAIRIRAALTNEVKP